MSSIEILVRKVSKYVTFGLPVASGSVVSPRGSDPRIQMLAYYLSLQAQSEKDYYHEVWLKKDGSFAVTEAWYQESVVSRKVFKDNLTFEQLTEAIGEEDANNIVVRLTEIIKKSEKEDWRPLSARRN